MWLRGKSSKNKSFGYVANHKYLLSFFIHVCAILKKYLLVVQYIGDGLILNPSAELRLKSFCSNFLLRIVAIIYELQSFCLMSEDDDIQTFWLQFHFFTAYWAKNIVYVAFISPPQHLLHSQRSHKSILSWYFGMNRDWKKKTLWKVNTQRKTVPVIDTVLGVKTNFPVYLKSSKSVSWNKNTHHFWLL